MRREKLYLDTSVVSAYYDERAKERQGVDMRKVEYFDYPKVVKEMHLTDVVLKRIEKEVEKEFPSDRMMYELHVLRAVRSGYWQKPSQNQKRKHI